MAETPKKISELPQIRNISTDDLLLVSDYDNGKCLSRKMTMQQLVSYVIAAVANSTQIKQQIKQQVESVMETQLADKTMEVVEQNIEEIQDLLDGIKDNEYLIDAGNSGAV